MLELWIQSGEQRKDVAWALIANGYTVKQITRTNKNWLTIGTEYGLAYEADPSGPKEEG
jgi:hypothetical protein